MPANRPRPTSPRTSVSRIACAVAAAAVLGLFAATLPAQGQPQRPPAQPQTSALIAEELDKPIELDLRNRFLPDVLDAIAEKNGVRFDVDEAVWELLPYGRQTPISVTVKDTSLRRTLSAVTQKLGVEWILRDEAIQIRPLPALKRTGRRATVEEVAGLDLLAGVQLDLLQDRPPVWELLEAVDLKLQELDAAAQQKGQPQPGFAVEVRLDDALREAPVYVPRNATLMQAMEAIAEQTSATWYPWDDTFVFEPKVNWVGRQLEKAVNLSYNAVEVDLVLDELSRAAGVPFQIEPGAVQRIPEQFRQVRLFLENATVRSALESLGSYTGLGYVINESGVYIYNEDAARPNARGGQFAGEAPVVIVDLGDGASLLLYESDLPADLRQRILSRRQEAIDLLRRSLPTTRPAEPEPQN